VTRPLLTLALLVPACAYPTDEALFPGPEGPPRIVSTTPEDGATDVPVNPKVGLTFDRYLDPFATDAPRAMSLSSGGETVAINARYDIVTRTVWAEPVEPLAPGVLYSLKLDEPRALPDFAGRATEGPVEVRFVTGETERVIEPRLANVREALQFEVLEGPFGCLGCHADGSPFPRTDLSLSNPEALAGLPARTAPGRELVVPGFPERSYLLHKVLPGYPDRVGAPMPLSIGPDGQPQDPPFEDEEILRMSRIIADWIASL
jgi:hypothetical protein